MPPSGLPAHRSPTIFLTETRAGVAGRMVSSRGRVTRRRNPCIGRVPKRPRSRSAGHQVMTAVLKLLKKMMRESIAFPTAVPAPDGSGRTKTTSSRMMMNARNHRGMGIRMLAAGGERQGRCHGFVLAICGWTAVGARLPDTAIRRASGRPSRLHGQYPRPHPRCIRDGAGAPSRPPAGCPLLPRPAGRDPFTDRRTRPWPVRHTPEPTAPLKLGAGAQPAE